MEKNSHKPGPSSLQRPIPATIATVIRDGNVLLVRRKNPPDAQFWGFPGGKIDFGETIESAAIREDSGQIQQHFVLIAVLCRWIAGEPVAGDDALDARWIPIRSLENHDLALSLGVVEVAHLANKLESQTL
jgi:ADP-ribose pyrophosphatase YjhB (NUDIX family)